jgi:hypothetical protein
MGKELSQHAYTMPIIVRARGYRLYDRTGQRYIDLYQNNGRALLGHRPPGISQAVKSTISRGLFAEYPSIYDGRLEKILKLMFTDYPAFRVYANRERTFEALSMATGKRVKGGHILDPAMTGTVDERMMCWRPFLPEQQVKPDLLLPIFPFPGSFAPNVVCVRDIETLKKMPASDMLSPFLIDALIKTISALIREMHSPLGYGSEFQRLIDVLEWDRRGPYINTRLESAAYIEVFKKALEQGVLLPPGENYPVIIPREFSEGEIQGVLRFVRSINGG